MRKVSIDRVENELNARDDGFTYEIWEIKATDELGGGNTRYIAQGHRRKELERIHVVIDDSQTTVKKGEGL